MRILSVIIAVAVLSFMTSCCTWTRFVTVTLKAGAPVESQSRLRLLSVEPDGTAQIEQPDVGRVYAVHPNSPTNHVSSWTLIETDPATQTARLSTTVVVSGCAWP